jgi:hypothetical protein
VSKRQIDVADLSAAFVSVTAILIDHLEKRGALSKAALRTELKDLVDEIELHPSASESRADTRVLKALVGRLAPRTGRTRKSK